MEHTDIIIIGCGPTGALLSGYLGRYGVKNIILEKEEGVTTDPRGITLDSEGLRSLQGVGGYGGGFWEHIASSLGMVNFVSAKSGKCDLHAEPMLAFDANSIGPMGHPSVISHKQPALEQNIRNAITKHDSCELRSGCTVDSISEDDEFVYVGYKDEHGESKMLRGKFLVGADGKTGFTRKRYLEERGVIMEAQSKLLYDEIWVALNWKITIPTPESHPNFPLFKKGYSSKQIYDAFFPPGFRFLCNPERAAVCGRFGPDEEKLWRFEFVVNNGEDAWAMAEEKRVMGIVGPYMRHEGSKYGLKEDVSFPEDCIEVLRSRPFNFSAKSCNKWALGRVVICGDAAHVFPPFGGQGIASGFRDSIALAWRLAVLTRPSPPPHTPILRSWYVERKQQLDRSLALTIKNGAFCTGRSLIKIFVRDWLLWGLQLIPGMQGVLHKGARGGGLTKYSWEQGMPFLEYLRGGQMIPQVFFVPLGEERVKPILTDDVIYDVGKKGLFQLLVLLDSRDELAGAVQELYDAKERCGGGELRVDEATFVITGRGGGRAPATDKFATDAKAYRVFMKEEFNPITCGDFPKPLDYDGHRLRRKVKGKYVILRPDRFIFADCMNLKELKMASEALDKIVSGKGMASRKF